VVVSTSAEVVLQREGAEGPEVTRREDYNKVILGTRLFSELPSQ
jgi:hypothetical protein